MEKPSLREVEVLELVGRHLSNPEIAERLYISVRTVESHVGSLIRKLGVADRRALVAYAAEANRPAMGDSDTPSRTNLPEPRSSFIGRRAEREQLHQMVLSSALVTLTGIGGCGKTRLALEVASDLEADFVDGTFFVDLSAVSDPTLVGQAVAGALRLQLLDPTPVSLADYFAERQTLLLFDNCEHLLDACAELADALVGRRCPGLRILATSREPLGLEGETVFRVPSLDIEAEAVTLFTDRARSARPDLQTDARSEATIAEICRRVDGIPLAVELAATQVAHLPTSEILDRLNDRFRLLVGGRRRIQRQQTLTAALDWSYDLLGPDEQLLLGRLGVFRGSFSLRAAEVICHPKAMELLRSLVAKSLVDVSDNDQVARYRLLESVRIYAEGKLVETGESEDLRSTHRDFYLELIESLPEPAGQAGNTTAGRGAGYERVLTAQMMPETDNLTAALEWSRQQGRYDLCARIAARMASHWHTFFRLSEMMTWWRDLDAGLPAEDREHRAMAFRLRSEAAQLAQEWEEVNVYSAQASALAGPHRWIDARAQFLQAMYWDMIDPLRSERHFRRSLEIEASMGWSSDPGAYVFLYGRRLLRAGGRDEALALLGDWLVDLGDSTPPPHLVGILALYGDTRRALELKSRALPIRTPVGRLMAELSEAILASVQGQFDEAEQHLATAASVERDFAVLRGDAYCLIGFAKVALDRGDHVRAARLLAVVDSSRGPGDRPFLSPLDGLVRLHCIRVLGNVLDPETAHTTQAEGAAVSLKEALDAELIRFRTAATANPAH